MMRQLLVFALLATAAVAPARGENYAVLAGVTQYSQAGIRHLDGPENDLRALAQTLTGYGFASSRMAVLINQQATHQNILNALRQAVDRAQPGDFVVFYFSGHGTSAFDRNVGSAASAIGPNSGALVPYDFDLSDPSRVVSTLLIGHRDLRPILARLNPKARALVILDACYSQNSARSLEIRGEPRFVDITGSRRSLPESVQKLEEMAFQPPRTAGDELYPNVVSLAAASAYETALDVSERLLATGRIATVDNRPHGAFTNSLLKGLRGAADTDHDGRVGVEELFRYVREDVRRNFPHTPQLLPARDTSLLAQLQFAPGTSRPQAPPEKPVPLPAMLQLRAEGIPGQLRDQLAQLPGVVLTLDDYDLLVRPAGNGYDLFHGSRTLIHHFEASETAQLVDRVGRERRLRELIDWQPAGQDFNLALDVVEPRYLGSFRDGQILKVAAGASADCYLLALDIAPDGSVTVLYPASAAEAAVFRAGQQVQLLETRVRPPYGTDYLKLVAFRQRPDDLGRWVCRPVAGDGPQCPTVTPGTADFDALMKLLNGGSSGRSQASLSVVTTE